MHSDINLLFAHALQGRLTETERTELNQRLADNPALREKYQRLLDSRDLTDAYAVWQHIDVEAAKKEARQMLRPQHRYRTYVLTGLLSAAAVLLFVFLLNRPKPVFHPQPPVLSSAMKEGMEKVEKSGQSGATLIINGSKTVAVASGSAAQQASSQAAQSLGDEADEATATMVTEHSKEFWMTLDDGTRVHLNYNSSVTYPLHFGDKERRVSIKGEAYFCVAHDSKRPFIVETPQGEVRDYGTEFDVSTEQAEHTTVVLVQGKVSVSLKDGREQMLRPGMKAVMATGKAIETTMTDLTPYLAWNTGQYTFDGSTLSELMAVVCKWYDMDVVFKDDAARNVRFSGNLDKYENIQPTLQAIETITGRNITLRNRQIIIK